MFHHSCTQVIGIVNGPTVVSRLPFGTMVMLMPGIGERFVLTRARLVIAVFLALLMVPLARIMADTALIDTYPGLVLVYVAQFLPFTVFLMTSYYRGIPKEIVDALQAMLTELYGFETARLAVEATEASMKFVNVPRLVKIGRAHV